MVVGAIAFPCSFGRKYAFQRIFLPFDEHLERVCYALHELDDLWVGEVCTRAAIDRNHFIPLTEPRPGGFALASDLSGVKKEATVRII